MLGGVVSGVKTVTARAKPSTMAATGFPNVSI